MTLSEFKDAITPGTTDKIENIRQNRFTHILVLREVTGPAKFTTDGERLNTTTIRTGSPTSGPMKEVRVVDLFHRKQPGAERRRAKSIQRDLLGEHGDVYANDRMHPNKMEQNSPESVLFGSAAGDENVSQRSRVYYNTAYSLRDVTAISRQPNQNAAGDELRVNAKDEQGTWKPGFVKPGAFFPSVVTLDSGTPEEALFLLGVILRTKRYGGSESRAGNVRNHILGIYPETADTPSNLELTRETVGNLAVSAGRDGTGYTDALDSVTTAKTLDPYTVKTETRSAYNYLRSRDGLTNKPVSQSLLRDVLEELRDDTVLQTVMETQREQVQDYITRFENNE